MTKAQTKTAIPDFGDFGSYESENSSGASESEEETKDKFANPHSPGFEEPTATGQAYFESFARKEARLRFDQLDTLTQIAKTLDRRRARNSRAPIQITANTLLRLGADWVIKNADQLDGITEERLRESMGLQ